MSEAIDEYDKCVTRFESAKKAIEKMTDRLFRTVKILHMNWRGAFVSDTTADPVPSPEAIGGGTHPSVADIEKALNEGGAAKNALEASWKAIPDSERKHMNIHSELSGRPLPPPRPLG